VCCEGLCFVSKFFTTWQVTRPSYKGNVKEISYIIMNFNEDSKAENIEIP
jgi:hypothetical protein